jgi:hypothetical protein
VSTSEWPKAFQSLLEASLHSGSESDEKLIWAQQASNWVLWKNLIAIFVVLEGIIVALTFLSTYLGRK